jgi:hypothetical protein
VAIKRYNQRDKEKEFEDEGTEMKKGVVRGRGLSKIFILETDRAKSNYQRPGVKLDDLSRLKAGHNEGQWSVVRVKQRGQAALTAVRLVHYASVSPQGHTGLQRLGLGHSTTLKSQTTYKFVLDVLGSSCPEPGCLRMSYNLKENTTANRTLLFLQRPSFHPARTTDPSRIQPKADLS